MKKIGIWISICLCVLLLSGCFREDAPQIPTELPSEALMPAENTLQTAPAETEAFAESPAEETQAPSVYNIPGVPVEDVILYFNEVCLDAEYVNGGNPCVVQKWVDPIRYIVYGKPTKQDLQILSDFAQGLNAMYGFPGMEQTEDPLSANLEIYFCSKKEMVERMGENFYGLDGAVTFWYQDDQIFDAIICCRKDLDQRLRNSVIQEELYNGLGPVQDTDLRSDSLIYSGFSEPQTMTAMDELILALLYHPDILCGMNAEQCEAVIRTLYGQ